MNTLQEVDLPAQTLCRSQSKSAACECFAGNWRDVKHEPSQWHTWVRKNESVPLSNNSSHTVNEPTASTAPPQKDVRYSITKTISLSHTHIHTYGCGKIRQSEEWWWLWHIAMPPTVVPVWGQSTSNWASVTHALCQSSSPALACNAWHIAEPPTGLLSPCPADGEVRGGGWR